MTPEEKALREELYDYDVYENFDSYRIEKRIYRMELFEITKDTRYPESRRYMFTHHIDKKTLRALYERKMLKALREEYERFIFLNIGD